MKSSFQNIDGLLKQRAVAISKLIVDKFKPEQIVCFACHVSGSFKMTCFAQSHNEQVYSFYLLVAMPGTERREHEIQDFVNSHYHDGSSIILSHGMATINAALQLGNYFFSQALAKGVTFYIANGATPAICIVNAKATWKPERQFCARMRKATSFFDSAQHKKQNNDNGLCLFMLHQAVEQACCALIYLFMGYRTDLHNLPRLLLLCSSFTNQLTDIFDTSDEDQRLLCLLQKSYIDARYQTSFQVELSDTETIYNLVEIFLERASAVGEKQLQITK